MLHGCEIGRQTIIGIGSTVLNRARVGANSIVGAHSLVTEGKSFPDGVLSWTHCRKRRDDISTVAGCFERNSPRHPASIDTGQDRSITRIRPSWAVDATSSPS